MRIAPFLLLIAMTFAVPLSAAEYLVSNKTELINQVARLKAGDTLVLNDGVYADLDLTVTISGEKNRPVTIKSKTPSKVVFSGQQNILITGEAGTGKVPQPSIFSESH